MNEPVWKLIPKTLMQQTQVVWREWPDGRQESMQVTTPEFQAWLAEGNVPTPADQPE
jgi:hypothetical protein